MASDCVFNKRLRHYFTLNENFVLIRSTVGCQLVLNEKQIRLFKMLRLLLDYLSKLPRTTTTTEYIAKWIAAMNDSLLKTSA